MDGQARQTRTHPEREAHTYGWAVCCMRPGSRGRGYWQYSTSIQTFTITANTQRFRYAAAPHAFCILAGPRTLKMDGMQQAHPIPGQAPERPLKQTAMGIPAIPAIQRLLLASQPTSPAPVRVWIRPGEITNGVINPGCAALPSHSAHSKPQTCKERRRVAKLNDKALCPHYVSGPLAA